ncbi:hypothetical protein GOBAR_AA20911 [Gossypium barbadense]|uniref:Plastocyanin-like domain-containing protein n=1 Tax=Gossypium barbadense TaxID=3634 RepID=A0A2P5X8S4_GOSBA|nr:hypothetical protein GOBAR_AA20911 [Gossypium barbadense]
MARLTLVSMLFLWAGSMLMVQGGDPTLFFEWNVTYGTIAPLGVPVKGILINGQFPGPNINSTTNNNIVVNVFNNLDEPFLVTWNGVQHRKNSWQDGVLGTNCPIPPGKNYTYKFQNDYDSLDVHVGQCFSVLVTANQEPRDYYVVASTRFTRREVTATGIIRYKNGKGAASSELPPPPVGWAWSLNQFRTFRWNLTSNAARPNPQGSYKYGSINITRTIKLANTAQKVDGKLRYALNGVSYVEPTTPLKLAEYYGVADKVFKYDTIPDEPQSDNTKVTLAPIVLNMTHRNFVEIIFENHESAIQSYHLSGYSFFAVGMDVGKWSPEKRMNYNLLDAVSRHTIQVFPNSWSAILLTFDNCGMWNLRSEIWDRHYLGQQLYASVISPNRSLKDEYNLPEGVLTCGIVQGMPRPPPFSS